MSPVIKKVAKWLGIAFLAFFGFRMVQFGIYLVKEGKEEKAKQEQLQAAKDKRLADFKAMPPEQHLAEARKGFTTEAEKHLAEVPDGFPGKAEVQEAFKKNAEQARAAAKKAEAEKAAKDLAQAKILGKALRAEFAKRLEQGFLDQGMNYDVTVSGKENEVLKLKWALASKVTANALTKSDIISSARSVGFKEVKLSDGYDFGWSWKLDK
jgi:FKBP-type peptidyl-prolyl cis-trans isomerase